MALNYSVALRPNPLKKDEPAKAYATAQVNGELSLKQLSRRVSMQTTVSRADVVAVLISTVENLLDALQDKWSQTEGIVLLVGKPKDEIFPETFIYMFAPNMADITKPVEIVLTKNRQYIFG